MVRADEDYDAVVFMSGTKSSWVGFLLPQAMQKRLFGILQVHVRTTSAVAAVSLGSSLGGSRMMTSSSCGNDGGSSWSS